jgi:hypothetical protein
MTAPRPTVMTIDRYGREDLDLPRHVSSASVQTQLVATVLIAFSLMLWFETVVILVDLPVNDQA